MKNFYSIFVWEIKAIFRDSATILLLFGAAILYSFLYGSLYGPEIVTNMPIGVIDNDRTKLSYEIIRSLDATQGVSVECHPADLDEAKHLMLQRKISGIVLIPNGLEANSLTGIQSHVSIFADGSYFLHYAALVKSSSTVILDYCKKIQMNLLTAKGIPPQRADVISQPVKFSVETLYNSYSGYATAIMPAVMMIIIQQTLVIIIAMIIGTQNEFKLWRRLNDYSTMSILFAKILAYTVATLPQVVYLLGIAYKIFGYPMRENVLDLITFMIPYLLSVICLGISLGGMFNRREASLLYIAPLSVFLVLWSGVSWPRESMPTWFYNLGMVVPSSSGIKGFVALRTCGSTLADVSSYYIMLWVLTGVYFFTAYYSIRMSRRRSFE